MINNNTSLYAKFKNGLKKTSSQISSIFTGNKIDDDTWDLLEEKMLLADINIDITENMLAEVKKQRSSMKNEEALIKALRANAIDIFPKQDHNAISKPPIVTLVIGVNGAGKTTTIGKLANIYKNRHEKVILCAADTFRAAAIEQLKSWADKIGVEIVTPEQNSDPAAAAYEATIRGINKKYDRIIIDTAGRLHTKHNLMEELKKIDRVITKAAPNASRETILVIDATAGQNATVQAETFNKIIPINGVIITKLDGTTKGGIALNIAHSLNIPITFVGLGEKADDLVNFDPEAYVEAIFTL